MFCYDVPDSDGWRVEPATACISGDPFGIGVSQTACETTTDEIVLELATSVLLDTAMVYHHRSSRIACSCVAVCDGSRDGIADRL